MEGKAEMRLFLPFFASFLLEQRAVRKSIDTTLQLRPRLFAFTTLYILFLNFELTRAQ
jgi:hypothetical protein